MDFFAINCTNFPPCPEKTPGLSSILWAWGPAMSQMNRHEHPQLATHSLVSDIPTIHIRDRLFVTGFHHPQRHQGWAERGDWHSCVLLPVHLVKNATKNVHLQQFNPDSGVKAKLFQFAIYEWKTTGKNRKTNKKANKPKPLHAIEKKKSFRKGVHTPTALLMPWG